MLILSLKSISKQSTRVIYSKRHDAWVTGGDGADDESQPSLWKNIQSFRAVRFFISSFQASIVVLLLPGRSRRANLLAYYIESNRAYHGTDLINCTPRKNNARPSSRARVMNVNPEIKLTIKERSDGWSRFKRMKLIARFRPFVFSSLSSIDFVFACVIKK